MFSGAKLTNAGQNLLSKVIARNAPITISKIALGDGDLNQDPQGLTSLVSEKLRTDIENIKYENGVSIVRATFSNSSLQVGFNVKEIGIFAVDPDTSGLILYAYDYVGAGAECDFLQQAGNVTVNIVIEEAVSFGNATSVRLTVNPKYVFVTMEEYSELTSAVQSEISTRQQQVNSLIATKATKQELAVERARINEMQANPGSTSGDLALADIKVGADGKTYASPGDAVRGQYNQLKGDLSQLSDDTYYFAEHLFDKNFHLKLENTINGYRINFDGTIAENADYVEVFYNCENELFVYLNLPDELEKVVQFRADVSYTTIISTIAHKNNEIIRVPTNAKYAVISYPIALGDIRCIFDISTTTNTNLIDSNRITINKIVNDSGVEAEAAGWFVTDYINVRSLSYVYISGFVTGVIRDTLPIIACYDESKKYLGIAYNTLTSVYLKNEKIELLDNTFYIRANFHIRYKDDILIHIDLKSLVDAELQRVDAELQRKYTTISIFNKVCCCGDSYTAGYIDLGDGATITNEDYAYPSYMAKITGNKYVNCGSSGANVIRWQNEPRGLERCRSFGRCQAYIVGLGINDSSHETDVYHHIELGSISHIGTDERTYYGGYSKIIREINTINPTAKIFCLTMPITSSLGLAYNQAVRDIVSSYKSLYPIHLIDLYEYRDMYDVDSLKNDAINGHYTAIGYQQFAENLVEIISKYINENVSAFQDVYMIPYDS